MCVPVSCSDGRFYHGNSGHDRASNKTLLLFAVWQCCRSSQPHSNVCHFPWHSRLSGIFDNIQLGEDMREIAKLRFITHTVFFSFTVKLFTSMMCVQSAMSTLKYNVSVAWMLKRWRLFYILQNHVGWLIRYCKQEDINSCKALSMCMSHACHSLKIDLIIWVHSYLLTWETREKSPIPTSSLAWLNLVDDV